ncbi:MAG TPA: acetyl-CoA carboxylase biotin carboxylase subunit [Gemmatimonadales bacterium]|nr:acetyl-CoA carboxylase biotin carboxylase subunit [Gemmatimonadales bacterium]
MNLTRVLVANRGEIALRVIRACHELGLEAVAVHSEADADALFVRAADRAVLLGPAPASESYLRADLILEAARASGADAVHPGYGFLSERAVFARAVEEAGLAWIGPPSAAIEAMGDKTSARRLMAAAGVPIVPGTVSPVRDPAEARRIAAEIGYPVLVKAAAGGGGKGMRVVEAPAELAGALESAASEAVKAFGDGAVYLEKFIVRPRHIEIQVLADDHETLHFGERECSIQRRHQKLVEEAPSVAVDAPLREAMGAAAVAAARAVGYRGAGTCEFLLAADGSFYFLEMNTRIQVEHPVTELVYGVDLVQEQLRIAGGGRMSPGLGARTPRGWAIECRITSEDPASGMLPSSGRIRWLRAPSGPHVRWDSGVETGSVVTLYYDSLLAKLIVHAPDRPGAIAAMQRALVELGLVGVATNIGFHRNLLAHPEFQRGAIDIQFLDRHPALLQAVPSDTDLATLAVATALLEHARRARRGVTIPTPAAARSPWQMAGRAEALR